MKAVVINEFGGADKLQFQDIPAPTPEAGEVQIKVAYAGVNPVDWKIREGFLQDWLPHVFPVTLGWDAAGVVSAVGEDVSSFKVGDPVWAYCRLPTVQHGTYAEYVTVPEHFVAPKPASLELKQAAAIPLVALTAWQALFDFCNLRANQTVLIHAGAGGVGSLAIGFAKQVGAKVITTASAKNHPYVFELGADEAVDYTENNFVQLIRQKHPEGVDVVLDCVGGETLQKSLQLVRPEGSLASIVDTIDAEFGKAKNVKSGFVFVTPNGVQLRSIGELLDRGDVRAPLVEELALEEAAEAQARSQAGHTKGKLVLKVS
jgi:NADPH2:quinone reductase